MEINIIAARYGLDTLETFKANGDEVEFYRSFLALTDHIPNKILEGVATSEEYADELYYRDEQAMEISTVYPPYEVGRAYTADELLTYGINDAGDPQLYRVVQAHTSQEDWNPDSRLESAGLSEMVKTNRGT